MMGLKFASCVARLAAWVIPASFSLEGTAAEIAMIASSKAVVWRLTGWDGQAPFAGGEFTA
jgi:hypothetical protein